MPTDSVKIILKGLKSSHMGSPALLRASEELSKSLNSSMQHALSRSLVNLTDMSTSLMKQMSRTLSTGLLATSRAALAPKLRRQNGNYSKHNY